MQAKAQIDIPTDDGLRVLRHDIKRLLVTTLRLEDVCPEDIGDDEPLFGPESRLGLDSLAALELLAAIEFTYKVRFGNEGTAREHFRSISSLASFVRSPQS